MTTFVNLTPHSIRIKVGEGFLEVPPLGFTARVKTEEEELGTLEGIPLAKREFGDVDMPDRDELTRDLGEDTLVVIVSSLVGEAIKQRGVPKGYERDVIVAPDTGPTAVRDEQGRIVAVTRLVVYHDGRGEHG